MSSSSEGIGTLLANKTLLAAIGCIVVVVIAGAVAIPIILDDNDEGHEHKFATAYSYDDENHWYVCTVENCSESSEKSAHDLTEETIEDAKHSKDGSKKVSCRDCGYERTETIPKHVLATTLSYNEETHWYACTADGCSVKVNRTYHMIQETVIVPATHYEDGSKKVSCRDCGYERTETIPKHVLATTYSHDEENHWYQCTECDITDKEKHVCDISGMVVRKQAKEGTMGILDGVCTVCHIGFTENVYVTIKNTSVMYDGNKIDIEQLAGFYKIPAKIEYAKSNGVFEEDIPCDAGEYSVRFTFDDTQITYNFEILPSILAVSGDLAYETHVSNPVLVILTGLENPKYCAIQLPTEYRAVGEHTINLSELNINSSNFTFACDKDKIKVRVVESIGARLFVTGEEDTEDGVLVSGIVIQGFFKANIRTSNGDLIKNVYQLDGSVLSLGTAGNEIKILIEDMSAEELSDMVITDSRTAHDKFLATVHLIAENKGGPSKELDGTEFEKYDIFAFGGSNIMGMNVTETIRPGSDGAVKFEGGSSLYVEIGSVFYLMFEGKIIGYGIVKEILESIS